MFLSLVAILRNTRVIRHLQLLISQQWWSALGICNLAAPLECRLVVLTAPPSQRKNAQDCSTWRLNTEHDSPGDSLAPSAKRQCALGCNASHEAASAGDNPETSCTVQARRTWRYLRTQTNAVSQSVSQSVCQSVGRLHLFQPPRVDQM